MLHHVYCSVQLQSAVIMTVLPRLSCTERGGLLIYFYIRSDNILGPSMVNKLLNRFISEFSVRRQAVGWRCTAHARRRMRVSGAARKLERY